VGADNLTYPPLNTLKRVCDDVWIVDGPVIRFGMPWPKIPFPTRMTVIRLGEHLFLHSPTPIQPGLKMEMEQAGRPSWIVGPNRLHYRWVPDWHETFPSAAVYLAPRAERRAGQRITFPHQTLERPQGHPWDESIATLLVTGSFMTEAVFFHRPSRTLVLADLIENFELHKTESLWHRWLIKAGGVAAPNGQMPRDMRLTFATHKDHLRAAVETMIGWHPARVIFAHGQWFENDGTSRLRQAFRWILG
jgi:hypothetical protein